MRIDELTIQNFKCFEKETFHFNPHFNVIIGKNGSGKSALLDALAGFLSFYLMGINRSLYRKIDPKNIRTLEKDGQPRIQTPVRVSAIGLYHGKVVEWFESLYENDSSTQLDIKSYLEKLKPTPPTLCDYANFELQESRKIDVTSPIFPLLAYYDVKRLSNQDAEIRYFKQEEGVFLGYKDSLGAKMSVNSFLSWFKTFEEEVLKFHKPLDEILFKLMKDTITSVIPEWSDLKYSNLSDDLIGIFKNENGETNLLPFKSLSDGYRNMIAMVADMVYRCIQLNPGLKERAVMDTEGIVLIDEIDLHLHPEWQRRVVGDLKRVFPKVQFVTTTHSPFIIQSLKQDELTVLDKTIDKSNDPIYQHETT